MRSVILLSMMLPAAAVAGANPATKTSLPVAKARPMTQCAGRPELRQAEAKRPSAGMHKLGDLPPAHAIYTVVREVDGCPMPVSVGTR